MDILDGFFNRIFKTDATADDSGDDEDALVEPAAALRFPGATVTRVAAKNRIDITIAGGGDATPIPAARMLGNFTGGTALPTAKTAAEVRTFLAVVPSSATPETVGGSGAGAPGASPNYAREDHQHVLGDEAVTTDAIAPEAVTLPKLGSDVIAVFGSFDGRLDDLEASPAGGDTAATPDTLVLRTSDGDAAARYLRALRLLPSAPVSGDGSDLKIAAAPGASAGVDNSGVLRIGVGEYVGGTSAGITFCLGSAGDPWAIPALQYQYTSQGNTWTPLGQYTVDDSSGYGVSIKGIGAGQFYFGTVNLVASSTLNLGFGTARRIARSGFSDGVDRACEHYKAEVPVSSTTASVPSGFSLTLSTPARPTRFVAMLSQRIGDDEAVHVFEFSCRVIGGIARFTSGAVPTGTFVSTPGVAGFQAAPEESGGATIDFRTQRDTASEVIETLSVWEVS